MKKQEVLLCAAFALCLSVVFLIKYLDSPKVNSLEAVTITLENNFFDRSEAESSPVTKTQTTVITTQVQEESQSPSEEKININTADVEELTALTGIGEAKAEAIVNYRNNNGLFRSVEEITNVEGIGEALLSKNADRITV